MNEKKLCRSMDIDSKKYPYTHFWLNTPPEYRTVDLIKKDLSDKARVVVFFALLILVIGIGMGNLVVMLPGIAITLVVLIGYSFINVRLFKRYTACYESIIEGKNEIEASTVFRIETVGSFPYHMSKGSSPITRINESKSIDAIRDELELRCKHRTLFCDRFVSNDLLFQSRVH